MSSSVGGHGHGHCSFNSSMSFGSFSSDTYSDVKIQMSLNSSSSSVKNIKISTQKYSAAEGGFGGTSYVLNKSTFGWRDLKQFKVLESCFENRRLQTRLGDKDMVAPTLLKPSHVEVNSTPTQQKKILMAACLPCFDEDWSTLSATLRSLAKNIMVHRKRPDRSFQLHVIVFIIQDGWNHASASLKEGIQTEWGCPSADYIDSIQNNYFAGDSVTILAPNAEVYYPAYTHDPGFNGYAGATVHPIFITKSKHTQKRNSHLLFFSLCYLLKPDCVFLTDAGTVYDPDCIHRLTEYLCTKQTKVIGVTAHQRVMSEAMMHEMTQYPYWSKYYTGSDGDSEGYIERFIQQLQWWCSPAPLQAFSHDSTFLLNTAIFNIIGALPLLPGPCQLISWSHLESRDGANGEGALDMYFRHFNMDVSRSNIIKASTILAEDSVLSFAMVLRNLGMKTVWVSGATFSSEPKTTWVDFLSENRLSFNGTLSAYLYYLIDDSGKDEFAMSGLGDSRALQTLWGLQLYQAGLQLMCPALISIGIYESVRVATQKYPEIFSLCSIADLDPAYVVTSIYFLVYVIWMIFANLAGKKPASSDLSRERCQSIALEIVYRIFAFINFAVSSFILFCLFDAGVNKNGTLGILLSIVITIYLIPLCSALLLSFSSAVSYISYSIPFLLQFTHYICFVPSFAFARIHDLTYNDGKYSVLDAKNAKKVKEWEFFWISLNMMLFSVTVNLTLVVLYISIQSLGAYLVPVLFILFIPSIIQLTFAVIYIIRKFLKGAWKSLQGNPNLSLKSSPRTKGRNRAWSDEDITTEQFLRVDKPSPSVGNRINWTVNGFNSEPTLLSDLKREDLDAINTWKILTKQGREKSSSIDVMNTTRENKMNISNINNTNKPQISINTHRLVNI